ncbi:MAG: hypothetical protein M3P85_06815 [Actinomycetota bacterium]|nr:hypothetical protein [Actinomycetota bacterium]PLS75977.1 MAG: hypothetical protein CYG61_04400 [Actinomycetota bacterium]
MRRAGAPQQLRLLRGVVALLLVVGTAKLSTHDRDLGPAPAVAAAGALPLPLPSPEPPTTEAPTTVAPEPVSAPTTATVAPPPAPSTTAATVRPRRPTTTAASPPPAPATTAPARAPLNVPLLGAPATADGVAPYRGLGTWVDVYDWSNTFTNGRPTTTPADVDRMAEAGVQTLYIQASKHDAPSDVLEPELLQAYIDRARSRGLKVVAWYLPTLVDVGRDLQRLRAVAALPGLDGLGVDIEARNVGDVNERNRRLIELSSALRQSLPGRTISAIVLPPVVLEVINPNFWPNFPYREIAPSYDLWMTMGYWTNRKADSGYREAYRYTRENVDRLRANLGQPQALVHPIGGIGDATSADDVEAFKRAVADTGGIGGSLYDWRTTAAGLWPALRGFRSG